MSVPPSSAPPIPPTTFQTPNGSNSASPRDLQDFLKFLNVDNPPLVLDKPIWLHLACQLTGASLWLLSLFQANNARHHQQAH
jgi:hypothetical protein